MDQFFKISARKSSLGTEVMGGLTTFLTMAYIVAVNPTILSSVGIPFNAALTATCLGAAIMTIVMGLIANRPIALASGMGINAVVAYTLCLGQGVDWRVAMACVFLEGLIILLLVLCGLREAIMKAIPTSLRHAIGIGIGLFIAFIGLKGGNVIVANSSTYITLGDFTSSTVIVALVSIALAAILHARNVKGGLLISIVVATIVGIPLGVTQLPTSLDFGLDFSCFAAPFQTTDSGTIALVQVFVQPILLLFVFSMLMSDFFDTMGVALAVARQADFADENDNVANIRSILTIDSAAAMVGGFTGASSITCYAESVSGAAAGARTGLSNIVVGVLFLFCAFLGPIFGMVSSAATCGALVVVGFLMMAEIVNIDWHDPALAFASFIVIIGIPFTYSITNGIGLGFLFYVVVRIFQGKAREIAPLMWIAAAAFLASFILIPLLG
jgi:adenine/guanine/hypoxanthine permease